MRGRRWYWAALIVLAMGGLVAVVALTAVHRPAQIALRMKPVPPLTMAACITEATHFGYSVVGARTICSFGKARSWYHAVLTNKGPGAYPSCGATVFEPTRV